MRCYKPPCTHGGYREKIGGYSKKVRTDMRRGGYSLRLHAHGGYRNWAIYQDPCSTGLIKAIFKMGLCETQIITPSDTMSYRQNNVNLHTNKSVAICSHKKWVVTWHIYKSLATCNSASLPVWTLGIIDSAKCNMQYAICTFMVLSNSNQG